MENINDKMYNVSNDRRTREAEGHKQKLAALSMDKLLKVISNKCNTIFIGAISQIEENYGELWGLHKEPAERTEAEREEYKRFRALRTIILNNGNNQLRAIENELKQYLILWQGYQYNLKTKERPHGQ